MIYTEAKQILGKHDLIVVTGPQRSGTRIASKMISYDYKLKYVDEKDFGAHDFEKAKEKLKDPFTVVHAPALSGKCHLFPVSVLIVFMKRSIVDIQASEHRILWNHCEKKEWDMYRDVGFKPIVAPISVYKYLIWRTSQRPLIKHWLELEYSSLEAHPLWVEKELRVNFKEDQTGWQNT